MRKDIEFKAEDGTILRGWHYLPDGASAPHPIIVMAHGYSGVKEMYLDHFAEAFAKAGLAALVQPQLRCEPGSASTGDRSLAADPRL